MTVKTILRDLQREVGITLTEVKCMIILLERVLTESCDSRPFILTMKNYPMALISAFHLVHKTLSADIGWRLKQMSTLFGIKLKDANTSEQFLLTRLGWRICIDKKDLEAASSLLNKVIAKFQE
jgi:hypothetical protein